MSVDLRTEICGVRFKNPIIAASGTYGFGREYENFYDNAKLGGISVKGLTLAPRLGNPPPRIAETPSGMLNAVGLQNPGVEAFLADELPRLLQRDTVVIANIAGNTIEEYVRMAEILSQSGVHMIEMNISCPNVKHGGAAFGTCVESVEQITRAVRPACKKPLCVKLSPNVADIGAIGRAAQDAGADALSLINTITGLAVDIKKRRPLLANITGGLSGPAVRPVALRMVWEVFQKTSIPIIGMGGIVSAEDVVSFMLCGASAVMMGTAHLIDPLAAVRALDALPALLEEMGEDNVRDLVGTLMD